MEKKRFLLVIVLMASLLILEGCAGMHVHDKVSPGDPKGYVKFYYLKSEGRCPTIVAVYWNEDMNANPYTRDFAGNPKGWTVCGTLGYDILTVENERSVLVVKKAGYHKFMVLIDGVSEPKVLKILVQEGMVVPIKFTFSDIKKTGNVITFTANTIFEEPIPFVLKK